MYLTNSSYKKILELPRSAKITETFYKDLGKLKVVQGLDGSLSKPSTKSNFSKFEL